MQQFDVRAAWKRAWRETRLIGRGNGGSARQFGVLLAACGARSYWDGQRGQMAGRLQSLLQCNDAADRESDRYRRTRDVLNSFGRLNPWRCFTQSPAKYRDTQRVRALRARLLERRLIAPEPGGYVTGLLSAAPAKLWWDDYPAPVAPLSRDDLALYEGRKAA
jgi:hypothetical protein